MRARHVKNSRPFCIDSLAFLLHFHKTRPAADEPALSLHPRPADLKRRGGTAFMLRDMLKVVAATAVFAGVHSFFASRTAKRNAAELFGERQRNGLYRVFYNGQ